MSKITIDLKSIKEKLVNELKYQIIILFSILEADAIDGIFTDHMDFLNKW